MENLIKCEIEREAKKRISKYSKALFYKNKYKKVFEKRTGISASASGRSLPKQWFRDKHYDPRYCLNHSKFLAKGIWNSLKKGTYETNTSLRLLLLKPTGGVRIIDSFSIPDAAVSKIFLNNIRKRNSKIFSDSSYAYHEEKTALDAIIKINSLINSKTIFVSQYDFSKYFDSIDHDYITSSFKEGGYFLTTSMERSVIKSVITHKYENDDGCVVNRSRGIPQGNSLSLFLANVAAHSLDICLSRLNGSFARFADDSVVINFSYEDALKCSEEFQKFSERSGVQINREKSKGIRILSENDAEMESVRYFDFLGYRFSHSGLGISDRSILRIKRRCIKIIYNHLILHPKRTGSFNKKRVGVPFGDWDLVTCLNELRGYIYGHKSQSAVDEFLSDTASIRNFSGPCSYFCLMPSGDTFRSLDGWLLYCLHRVYLKRAKILSKIDASLSLPVLTREKILNGSWYGLGELPMETSLPSFFTAWRASRKSWSRFGLGGVDALGVGYSYL